MVEMKVKKMRRSFLTWNEHINWKRISFLIDFRNPSELSMDCNRIILRSFWCFRFSTLKCKCVCWYSYHHLSQEFLIPDLGFVYIWWWLTLGHNFHTLFLNLGVKKGRLKGYAMFQVQKPKKCLTVPSLQLCKVALSFPSYEALNLPTVPISDLGTAFDLN